MLKDIGRAVATAAVFMAVSSPVWATPDAETINAKIADTAGCSTYAAIAGWRGQQEEFQNLSLQIQIKSGIGEWLSGYWSGVGATTALVQIRMAGDTKEAAAALFIENCMGEGQVS